jgi:hypothetical protein
MSKKMLNKSLLTISIKKRIWLIFALSMIVLPLCIVILFSCTGSSLKLDDFEYKDSFYPEGNAIRNEFQFSGNTKYRHDIYREWIHYGNLFKIAMPNVECTIAQSKADIAEDIGIPGLSMQEGFLNGLLTKSYISLDQPSVQQLEESLKRDNVLALIDPGSETGKQLVEKSSGDKSMKVILKNHQYTDESLIEVDAFILENNKRRLFVISSTSQESRNRVKELFDNTEKLLKDFDLHKGWFGAKTLVKSVTCTAGHYLDVIGKGMNEGNDWFVFDGYMDFLAKKELEEWISRVKLPIVTDVGTSPIYGCKNYEGLQVQGNYTRETWVNYAHQKGGYVFRSGFDTLANALPYDGYIASDSRARGESPQITGGNNVKVKNGDVPFISSTGNLDSDAIPSMVLFIKKGEQLTTERLWESILSRREVAILDQGKMMGPALYRNTLEMLLLDRVFLEEYFGDRISIDAVMQDYQLNVTFTNTYSHAISGTLDLILPSELKLTGDVSSTLKLPANSTKTLTFKIKPGVDAMNKANPIAVHYNWGTSKKSTLAMLNLPPAISVHQLLYGHSPTITYPVTIHNFSDNDSFPVKIEVLTDDQSKKVVFENTQTCSTGTGTFKNMTFELKVSPGKYKVKVTALGIEYISQLGAGVAAGAPSLSEIDLNGDGVNEYRMENDSVQVTLLRTGARVIEYIVKNRHDNVLFKLWPKKAADDKRPFRKRGYYPFGGFEDFLGQGSMETWKVYDAVIVKKEGDYVQVKMSADYFGNKLEKIYTLYGNSPLLEVRFALTFKNPEANVLGPQPIVELGKKHWTEDIFTIPQLDGLHEYKMIPDQKYGRLLFLKEGWYAGYDSKEDITLVGAYPVSQPLFLHMWMNHPSNNDAHYYYVEFQPWTPIYQKSTMYFTYYLWGAGGPWRNGLKALRERNLITIQ